MKGGDGMEWASDGNESRVLGGRGEGTLAITWYFGDLSQQLEQEVQGWGLMLTGAIGDCSGELFQQQDPDLNQS